MSVKQETQLWQTAYVPSITCLNKRLSKHSQTAQSVKSVQMESTAAHTAAQKNPIWKDLQ